MNGTGQTNGYDDANRLTSFGAESYTYNANGRRVTKVAGGATTTYTYNALDRLTGVSDGTTTATYTYNGDQRRVAKTVGGTTTGAAWAGGRQLTDGTSREFLWGVSLIGEENAGTIRYGLRDAQGSTTLVALALGAAVGSALRIRAENLPISKREWLADEVYVQGIGAPVPSLAPLDCQVAALTPASRSTARRSRPPPNFTVTDCLGCRVG